jgi:DNA modification methylase
MCDLNTLTKAQLLLKCAELELKHCKSKNKSELIGIITNHNTPLVRDNNAVQDNSIIILNNDCMVELSNLEDNSIDCVITDPPYFIDKLDNKWSFDNINNEVANSHIKHLPKGMKFDKSQVKNLYDYYLELSKLLFQKMKNGAYFLSFSSPRLYHAIAMSCEIAGFEIRDMINWTYTQSMLVIVFLQKNNYWNVGCAYY